MALALLEKEYAATSSESKRQRLEAFRGEVVCPECKGSRLRPEARVGPHCRPGDPRGDGTDGGRSRRVFQVARPAAGRAAGGRADPRRDRGPAGVSRPRGPGISHARPARRHLERRRVAAGAAGQRAGLRPGRRLLRAGRAVDRPAPPRHRAIDRRAGRPASPRQYSGGGRARRDDHAAGRLAGGPGAGGGATRRPRRCPGHARSKWPPAIRSPAATWPAASRSPCRRAAAASPPRARW